MDNNPVEAAKQELIHREMYRKSRDIIRVFNPLETEFRFKYDSFIHTIPAHSYKDLERYLAQHYFQQVSQRIIGDMIVAKGQELLEKREKRGQDPLLDKYAENREIWDKAPKMDDPKLLAQIFSDVIIGLVEEYGMDAVEVEQQAARQDTRPAVERVFDEIKPISSTIPGPKREVVKPLGKHVSAEEVTADEAA